MRHSLFLAMAWLATALAGQSAYAGDAARAAAGMPGQEGRQGEQRDPFAGAVLNRTVTVMGREFYQYFSAAWRDKDVGGRYAVSVHERPSAIRGSEMWVQYRGQRIFHAFLSPARAAVRKIGRNAAELAFRNALDIDVQRLMVQKSDLGPEEI